VSLQTVKYKFTLILTLFIVQNELITKLQIRNCTFFIDFDKLTACDYTKSTKLVSRISKYISKQ
jgi:hypothetical protein